MTGGCARVRGLQRGCGMPRFAPTLLGALGAALMFADCALGLRHAQFALVDEIHPRDIDRIADQPVTSRATPGRFVLERAGVTILDIPDSPMDGTFRTHVAWCPRAGDVRRLCVFDAASRESEPARVFSWDGTRFVPSRRDASADQVLAALAARDDGGTRLIWLAYFLLKPAVWVFYTALLLAFARGSSRLPPIPTAVARLG